MQAHAAEIPVFIFAGQSIAINSGTDTSQLTPEQLQPKTNVWFYNARAHYPTTNAVHWNVYQAPTGPAFPNNSESNRSEGSFGPEFITAPMLSQQLYGGQPVAVFKYAVGASSLYADYNPTNPGPLFLEMRQACMDALATLPMETGHTGKVAGFFWTQGESDALDGPATSAAYGANLQVWINTWRAHLGYPELPFVYGRILPQWPNSEGVRSGQQALSELLPHVAWVDADDLATTTKHYNNAGTMELGRRYAVGFDSILRARMGWEFTHNGGLRARFYGLPMTPYRVLCSSNLADWREAIILQTDVRGLADLPSFLTQEPIGFFQIGH